jgi:hypothetical protein
MGAGRLGCLLFVALLLAREGNAQLIVPEAPPGVTAANAAWQINGEAVFYEGNFYYPTGPTVFFDGAVMVRTGLYRGVPLYQDRTLQPYSIVYVPIGGRLLRPYEMLRTGDLAGTYGSRTPSILSDRFPRLDETTLSIPEGERPEPAAAATIAPVPPPVLLLSPPTPPKAVESIPAPTGNSGIWIEFDGTRWFLSGTSVRFTPDRFEPIGNYRGFAVYHDKSGSADTIWVPIVANGPVAPYSKR